jgi:hypothetical protein
VLSFRRDHQAKGLVMIEHEMKPHWRGTAETGRKKDLILKLLAEGRSLYSACLDARIPYNMVYVWRRTDSAFRTACSKAVQASAELRAKERNHIKEERQAEQQRRVARWRPVNRIAP